MQQETKLLERDVIINSEVRDSGGKVIFEDNILCYQTSHIKMCLCTLKIQ